MKNQCCPNIICNSIIYTYLCMYEILLYSFKTTIVLPKIGTILLSKMLRIRLSNIPTAIVIECR